MKQPTTVYLYELAWILPSIAIPVGMLVALAVTAFGVGIHLPGNEGRVNPTKVVETPPFDQPGIVALSPGRYEVRLVAVEEAATLERLRAAYARKYALPAPSDAEPGPPVRYWKVEPRRSLPPPA